MMTSSTRVWLSATFAAALLATPDSAGAIAGLFGSSDEEIDPERLEFGLLPVFSINSDNGLAFGANLSLVQFDPDRDPYQWSIRAVAILWARTDSNGGIDFPMHDYRIDFDVPGLWDGRLRLSGFAAFSRILTNGYYGLGNASRIDSNRTQIFPRYYQYESMRPAVSLGARLNLLRGDYGELELFGRAEFLYNIINVYPGSRLAEDLAGASGPATQRLLVGTGEHGLWVGHFGIAWDTRDNELTPSSGMFHDITLAGAVSSAPVFAFGGLCITTRFFIPLWAPYLVLATRLLTDVAAGGLPIYSMTGHGGLHPGSATGGGRSIRGIPAYRFHGQVKLLGNLELRGRFFGFDVWSQRFEVGALVFADAGRVWSEVNSNPELDGGGPLFQIGTGGGLRLHWGEAFVVRADLGYSPTEKSFGYYIDVQHIF